MKFIYCLILLFFSTPIFAADKCFYLMQAGEMKQAKECYSKIKDNIDRNMGLCLVNTGMYNHDEALYHCKTAYDIKPSDKLLMWYYGQALQNASNYNGRLNIKGYIDKINY